MSNDKLDALIERIASEHGIVLSQDDPVLMMHTLNEVLLEQNKEAHAELLRNYQAILEENFNRWREYSTKKSNALINSSMGNAQLTRDQFLESCIQLIDEKIKSREGQEIYELTRISRASGYYQFTVCRSGISFGGIGLCNFELETKFSHQFKK